jgi:F-type H+-transporting ATPase subunit delta
MKHKDIQKAKLYAQAIFELARDTNDPNKIWNELSFVADLMKKNDKMFGFFRLPFFSLEEKSAFLDKIFQDKLDKLSVSFMKNLIYKKYFHLFPSILRKYQDMLDVHLNRQRITITTAVSLSQNQQQKITKEIDKLFEKDVVLESCVDSAIIGGAILNFGNSTVDASLLRKLRDIQKNVFENRSLESLSK